jgi:hypothetical protein
MVEAEDVPKDKVEISVGGGQHAARRELAVTGWR